MTTLRFKEEEDLKCIVIHQNIRSYNEGVINVYEWVYKHVNYYKTL